MAISRRLKSVEISSNAISGNDSSGNRISIEDLRSSPTTPQNETSGSQNDVHLDSLGATQQSHFEASDHTESYRLIDGEGRTRVKRGVARAKDIWSLPEGEKILVAVNELGQPIEKPGGILGSWLGTVARRANLCPLNYTSWRKVPHTVKKNLINLTLTKFVIPLDNRRTEKWILTSISSKWKDYKYDLKKEYFVEEKSQEEIASNVPPGIYSPQWVDIVNYWLSEKSRRYSDIGKAARANQSTPHTSGTRSFARTRDLFVKKNGRQPRRIEWYSITHRHENGTYISEECQQFVDEANALVKERVNAAEFPDEYIIEEEVFNELMGEDRYGRVKGYGLGVSAADLRMVQTTSRAEEQPELDFLRREIANEKALREEENQKMQKLLELRDREHQVELQDLRDQMRLLTASVLRGSGGTGSFMPST